MWLLALQGLFLGIVILRKATRNPKSNRLIALLLFIFFLACVGLILKEWKHDPAHWIQIFPFYHLILVGPIIHLFLRSELEPNYQPGMQDRSHFLFGIWSFHPLILSALGIASIEASNHELARRVNFFFDYGDVFVWLVITSYLVLGLTTYKNFKSSPRSVWIKQFLDLFVFFQFAIWLPVIALHVSPYAFVFDELGLAYETVYLPFTLLIYWIGIKWFVDSPTLTFKSVTKRFVEKRLSGNVPKQCIAELYERIEKYGLYRHQDVRLDDVAGLFRVSEDTITYLLHQELGRGFDEFIDSIRVEQLIQAAASDKNRELSFEELALRHGFASAQSGATAIKLYTTKTDEEIDQLKNKVKGTTSD